MGRITAFGELQPTPACSDDAASLVAEVGRSMIASLKQGNAVVCIATGTHRRLLVQHLEVNGVDVVSALMREQLVCLNALDTLTKIMVDGELDVIRFAEVIGAPVDRAATRYPRVLIFGELDLVLRANVAGAAIKLDKLWWSFLESRPAFFRCPDLESVRDLPGRALFASGALAFPLREPN